MSPRRPRRCAMRRASGRCLPGRGRSAPACCADRAVAYAGIRILIIMMMSWGMDEDAAPRKRIKRGTKVAESLAQEIVREIVARKLEPGTVLPSEAEM